MISHIIKLKNNITRREFLSGSFLYLFANLLSAAIPFILLPVLTRYLSASEYGQVAIYQLFVAGLVALVGVSANGASGVKYYESNFPKREMKIFIGNCLTILFLNCFIAMLIVSLFENELSEWLSISAKWFFIGIAMSGATCINLIRMTQWQVRKEAKNFGLFQIFQSVFSTGLSLLLVVCFMWGADGRMWALSIAPIVFLLISLIMLHKDGLLGFEWRPKYLREILTFGIPIIPHSVGAFLLSSVDRFVINDKLGLEQVGVYMVAVQLVAVMGLVFDAINNAYVPWLFERLKRNQCEEKRQIVRWTYAYCLALVCFTGFVFIAAPPLVTIIVGKEYSDAAKIIGWLALGQAFNGMYLMVTNYIFYSKRTALLALSTLTSGLIGIGLLFIFIDYLGLKGAAVAYAISMALKFLMTWFVANLRHPMPWFNFERSSENVK